MDFGKILRGLRQSKGLTQSQIAERIGVSKGMVSAYENNIRLPSYEVLLKLSSLFKVSTDFLLENKTAADDYSLDGLTAKQIDIVLSIITEFKRANNDWEG